MNCLTKRLGHWTCYMTTAGTAETPYWHQRCTSTILYPQALQEKKNANLETNRGTPLFREVVFFSSTHTASVICTFWSSKLCFLTGKHVYTAESCPLMCMMSWRGCLVSPVYRFVLSPLHWMAFIKLLSAVWKIIGYFAWPKSLSRPKIPYYILDDYLLFVWNAKCLSNVVLISNI